MSPFDDPTEFAEAAAVFGAAPGDDRSDAALAKSAAMRVGIVATVGVDDLGLAKRSAASAASAANRRDRVDQRQQLRDIVAVRAGQDRANRNAVRVYEDVVFGPWSCAIGGVWPGLPQRLALTMNRQPHMRNRAGQIRAACRVAVRAACPPPPGLLPVVQPTPASRARAETQPGRQMVPSHPCLQHEQDAIECCTVRDRQTPRVSLASRFGRWK